MKDFLEVPVAHKNLINSKILEASISIVGAGHLGSWVAHGLSFIGSTVKDAYLVLLDTTLLVYFVPYLYMFSAYIVIRKKNIKESDNNISIPKNRMIAKVVGLIGFFTTLFAMIIALVPSHDTSNIIIHEIKTIGGFSLFIFVGAWIFWWGKKKNQ